MKDLAGMSKSTASGYGDARNNASGSSMPGLGRKLPPNKHTMPDARGRAPGSADLAEAGHSPEWAKATETVPVRG